MTEESGFERKPPQNRDAEMSVLGALMLSKDAMVDAVEILTGADFYIPAHEIIFDAALDLFRAGKPVDAITVSAELQTRGALTRAGGAEYLHTLLTSVPSAASAGYHARIVRDQAVLRRLVEAHPPVIA